MEVHLHQIKNTLADFQGIFKSLKNIDPKISGLHIFPELFLSGYPLQDLCLQEEFIQKYHLFLEELNQYFSQMQAQNDTCFLMGGPFYEKYSDKNYQLFNAIYECIPGKKIKAIYYKKLLPNYDIFDEKKYFSEGSSSHLYTFQEKKFGLLICEDMWSSEKHQADPICDLYEEVKNLNIQLNAVINLSASPFALNKYQQRVKRSQEVSRIFNCPLIYCNQISAEDEILFDGRSFVTFEDRVAKVAMYFQDDHISYTLPAPTIGPLQTEIPKNDWSDQFKPGVDFQAPRPTLKPLNEQQCEELVQAILFGLKEYAAKNGFQKYIVGLSGGIDSALVLALLSLSTAAENIEAICMPSIHTSSLSLELSKSMCEYLGINLHYLPIKFSHSVIKNQFQTSFEESFEGLTDENIQSRLRGLYLYTRSNQTGATVINTSNKSELAVGYSTLYGDSVGSLSLIGDLYKSEVFQVANYLNLKVPGIIPNGIITRPPSAELKENQKDTDSLPDYSVLDPLLECILSYQYSNLELVKLGFSEDDVTNIYKKHLYTEFKRNQFCPIIKLKPKSFGFGRRIPISKNIRFKSS
jgi:NAD+ synthase (glutamine-hydrolysing)